MFQVRVRAVLLEVSHDLDLADLSYIWFLGVVDVEIHLVYFLFWTFFRQFALEFNELIVLYFLSDYHLTCSACVLLFNDWRLLIEVFVDQDFEALWSCFKHSQVSQIQIGLLLGLETQFLLAHDGVRIVLLLIDVVPVVLGLWNLGEATKRYNWMRVHFLGLVSIANNNQPVIFALANGHHGLSIDHRGCVWQSLLSWHEMMICPLAFVSCSTRYRINRMKVVYWHLLLLVLACFNRMIRLLDELRLAVVSLDRSELKVLSLWHLYNADVIGWRLQGFLSLLALG